MSNPGEWIDFAELCRRVPSKSAGTLRRLYKHRRSISYRQLVPGGRVEFNWRTVERELRQLESPAIHALSTPTIDAQDGDIQAQLDAIRRTVDAIARSLAVTTD